MKNQFALSFFFTVIFANLAWSQIDLDHPRFDRQYFATDLYIHNSACIGSDCPTSGYGFGFNTFVLRENNLRILFEDTSTSAGFATTDWLLEANGSSSGGTEHFAIIDVTAARSIFKMEAGAPNNALYIEDMGRIGLGTDVPAVELHVRDGDTPTFRLEQDGSSGFTAQTWDIGGNETNFFVRDISNGSTYPFRISPGAPNDMISIDGGPNRVGIGVRNPETFFQIRKPSEGGAEELVEFDISDSPNDFLKIINTSDVNNEFAPGILSSVTSDKSAIEFNAVVADSSSGDAVFQFNVRTQLDSFQMDTAVVNRRDLFDIKNLNTSLFRIQSDGSMAFNKRTLYLDGPEKRVGIGTLRPMHDLHVVGDIGLTGLIVGVSDARLKDNIASLTNARSIISALDGKSYVFKSNEFNDLNLPEGRQYGLIAQDVEKVLPGLVYNNSLSVTDQKGHEYQYKGINYSGLIPVLVNALKEQDEIIQDQSERIKKLEKSQEDIIERLEKLEK